MAWLNRMHTTYMRFITLPEADHYSNATDHNRILSCNLSMSTQLKLGSIFAESLYSPEVVSFTDVLLTQFLKRSSTRWTKKRIWFIPQRWSYRRSIARNLRYCRCMTFSMFISPNFLPGLD